MTAFIREIAATTDITLLAGAGTSIESGLPSWRALIESLLVEVAGRQGLGEELGKDFAEWTIEREGLTGAAAVANASLGGDFASCVHEALYPQQLTPPPGPSALALAQLANEVGWQSVELATTNYDLILEAACRTLIGRSPTSVTGPKSRAAYRVLHLHGVLQPRGNVVGDLILSERDYHLMQEDSAWQQQYFHERLGSSTCLFVGASLTDPNLLRYLYRDQAEGRHHAIFVRQQDAALYDGTDAHVVQLRERSAEARWQQVGVNPLHLDYYSQSAQVIHEVLQYRQCASARRRYRPLPARLTTWRNKLDRGVLSTGSSFATIQDDLHDAMSELLDGVREDLHQSGHRVRGRERLVLTLWVYNPQDETLTNWASSDRVWRDPRTLQPLAIDWTSDFVSVQAFCAGSLVSQSTEEYSATRWDHVVGAPIYLESTRQGRLPVGAITLASTLPAPDSALHRGLATLRRSSIPRVEVALSELLTSETVSDHR